MPKKDLHSSLLVFDSIIQINLKARKTYSDTWFLGKIRADLNSIPSSIALPCLKPVSWKITISENIVKAI
jgi:hypothetical protein